MALITCPECNGQVSEKATTCPHCGYPLAPQLTQQNENHSSESAGTVEHQFCIDRVHAGKIYIRCKCGCTIEKPFSFVSRNSQESYTLNETLVCPQCHTEALPRTVLIRTPNAAQPQTQSPSKNSTDSLLVPCVNCGKMTNKYRLNCENCGKSWSKLNETSSEKSQSPASQPRDLKRESKSSSGSSLIWGLILGMAVIIIIAVSATTKDPYSSSSNTKTSGNPSYSSSSSSSSYSSSSSKKYDEDDIKSGVYVLAKKCVKSHLKSPSTAEFTAMSDCGFSKGEGNIYMMTGYVDSQNSFGAMLQEQWSIMAEVNGDKVSLVMVTIGDQMYFD